VRRPAVIRDFRNPVTSVSRNLLIATAVCSALLGTGVAEAKNTAPKKGATACVAAPATTGMGAMGGMGGSQSMAGGPGGAEDALLSISTRWTRTKTAC